MQKYKSLKPILILFAISIAITIILTLFKYQEGEFALALSDNFFIMGTLYITIGIIFEIVGWSSHKKYLRKPVNKEELEELKHSHKDAGLISKINNDEEAKKKKEIFDLLWKIFVIVGFVDLGLSILVALIQ